MVEYSNVIKQYEIYLVALDPTFGHEIRKTRPCVVISPDEMNQYLSTIIIAPMTTKQKNYPTRIGYTLKGKSGAIILDQLKTVDKGRLVKRLDRLNYNTTKKVKAVLKEMLVD